MAWSNIIDFCIGLLKKIVPVFLITSSKEKFFDKSNGMFMISSQDGIMLEVNKTFASSLGYRKEDLIGTSFMRLVHPKDRQFTKEAMEELNMGGDIIESNGFTNRYKSASGAWVLLQWTATRNGDKLIYATARIVIPTG